MRRVILLCLVFLPSAVMADGFGFQTPSGNIYCNGYGDNGNGGDISCKIVERSGEFAQRKPNSCTGYWGHEYHLEGNGRATMSCDNTKPSRVGYTALAPYGETGEFEDITCTSEKTGFTCTNNDGHGFFLSRQKQLIF